jgi:hypothetical protein
MNKQFDEKIYYKYVRELSISQFIEITNILYAENRNNFTNFCVEAEKMTNKTIKPIKQFDEQFKFKKSLYTEAKIIKNEVIRKKIFADLRQIQKKLDDGIDCFIILRSVHEKIKKEI